MISNSPVANKEKLLKLIHNNQRQIQLYGVKRLGLFGSFVRDQPTPGSDVDVLVEFIPTQKTFDNFINLSYFLEELFQRYVEIVTPESLSPYIGPHILKEVEYVSLNA